jgi:hypothetical protein
MIDSAGYHPSRTTATRCSGILGQGGTCNSENVKYNLNVNSLGLYVYHLLAAASQSKEHIINCSVGGFGSRATEVRSDESAHSGKRLFKCERARKS